VKVVTAVAETSHLPEHQRRGEASRKLAVCAAIVAAPTAVTGWFGMNFNRLH
jgi:magnesium transporter